MHVAWLSHTTVFYSQQHSPYLSNLYQKRSVAWVGYLLLVFLLHAFLSSLHFILGSICDISLFFFFFFILFSLPALSSFFGWSRSPLWVLELKRQRMPLIPKLSVGRNVWLCIHFMIGILAKGMDSRGML